MGSLRHRTTVRSWADMPDRAVKLGRVPECNGRIRPWTHSRPDKSTDRLGRKAVLDGRSGSSNVYQHTAAAMSKWWTSPIASRTR